MKKGVANIWWVIIAAVMALIVFVVIMVIFTGKASIIGESLSNCESKFGVCQDCKNPLCEKEKCDSGVKQPFECPLGPTKQICCIGAKG